MSLISLDGALGVGLLAEAAFIVMITDRNNKHKDSHEKGLDLVTSARITSSKNIKIRKTFSQHQLLMVSFFTRKRHASILPSFLHSFSHLFICRANIGQRPDVCQVPYQAPRR